MMRLILRTLIGAGALSGLLLLSAPEIEAQTLTPTRSPTPTLGPVPGFVRCDVGIPGAPNAIASADFNRDGVPDLAVVDTSANRVFIRLSNRSLFLAGDCIGALAQGTDIDVMSPAAGIAAGDFEENATPDLAVAVQAGVVILRGNGTGLFMVESPLAAGSNPQTVSIIDVDGDGFPDIVVGNGAGNAITILYQTAGGGFDPPMSLAVGGAVTALVAQDLNNDSFVDIAAATNLGQITVFLQNRDAPRTFRVLPSFTAGVKPTAMALGDFNRNGSLDLAITSGGTTGKVSIFLNQLPDNENQPFVFSDDAPTGMSPMSPSAVGVEVLNLLFPLYVVVANQGSTPLPFFLSNADGTITEIPGNCLDRNRTPGPCSVGTGARALVLADVDGDGRSDVITTDQDDRALTILLSSEPPSTPPSTPTSTPTITPPATATATVTPTASPTITSTYTPTITPTNTAGPTRTFTITPTPTPRCFTGGICIQGQSCQISAMPASAMSGEWLLVPVLAWWLRRRHR